MVCSAQIKHYNHRLIKLHFAFEHLFKKRKKEEKKEEEEKEKEEEDSIL